MSPRSASRDIDDEDVHAALLLGSRRSASVSRSSSPVRTHVFNSYYESTWRGRFNAYYLGVVVCMAGFLFGYDSGLVGGVLTLSSFETDFGYSKAQAKRTSGLAVSLQQLGGFVASFLIWPITHRIGRRKSLMLCSLVFCTGAMFQTVNTHSLPTFYFGRIIAGLGLGGATVVVPMYTSEMSPPELRARIGSLFQFMFTIGILVSYWTVYGVKVGLESTSRQWQIPVALQLVPAGMLGIGMFTLKESTRWLTQCGRHGEALESLRWIRAGDTSSVRAEMEDIRAGVALEAKVKVGFRIQELLEPRYLKLVVTSFLVFTAQNATGATAFAYFGPQYFGAFVGSAGNRDLLLTGLFGFVKVIACGVFIVFLSERFGRRTSFVVGGAAMATIFYATAAVVKMNPPPDRTDGTSPPVNAAGIVSVALIYLFVTVYNMTWGPLPYPYVSEIFPTRIREPGVAVGIAASWTFNFVFTLATPYMISNLGWATFLVWGVFNTVIAIGSAIFLKETKGKTLEQINAELDAHEVRIDHSRGVE